jgi:hypothetical protein
MKSLLDILPGLPMSVAEVTHTVQHMWDSMESENHAAMSDFRASQMNLVLHFGLKTTEAEAKRIFETAIAFAQRYPCRIIVLAPRATDQAAEEEPLHAKLFSQCYVGPNLRDLCCCEALMLSYPIDTAALITHAVSLWLETDLPVYHWFHRVPPERIAKEYQTYLHRSRRVLFDRDVDGSAFDQIKLGEGTRVVDLALARTLPIRQNLGQFLSNFRPASLIDGLANVTVSASKAMKGEGHILLEWTRRALETCAKRVDGGKSLDVSFEQGVIDESKDVSLAMEWNFRDEDRYLRWEFDHDRKTGHVACSLGGSKFDHPLHIEGLSEDRTLAEALFFTSPS